MAANVDELASFLIRDVEGLEESAKKEEALAGSGSYGYVFKVNVNGVERIAKKIHSIYVNQVNPEEKQGITSKFRGECIILSKLKHSNIVQFVGVHYGRGGMTDLTLFMECLSSDLDKFLTTHPNLPLSLKLSILRDISSGLVYLHCEPPIVHRDLTARNILISDRHQAKIADLGMAKLVDIQAQLAYTHTQTPGQMFYMPPEALKEKASCTPKLDIFSFGHLALYTVNQEFPKVYNVTMTMNILQQGISERLKRRRALDAVGEGHCLYPIITECLFDHPDQRPTSRSLNSRLCCLASQHPRNEPDDECEQLRKRVAELDTKNADLQATIRSKNEAFARCHRRIAQQDREIQGVRQDYDNSREEIEALRMRIDQLKRDEKEQTLLSREREKTLALREEEITKVKEQLTKVQQLAQEQEIKLQERPAAGSDGKSAEELKLQQHGGIDSGAGSDVQHLQDRIREQAQLVMKLKREQVEQSRHVMSLRGRIRELELTLEMIGSDQSSYDNMLQDIEDERDKVKDDFDNAKEEIRGLKTKIRQLEQELIVTKAENLSFYTEGESATDCKNANCKVVRTRYHRLESDFVKKRDRAVHLEKIVVSERKRIHELELAQRTVLDDLEAARVMAATYEADFKQEREDRQRARGELEDIKKKTGGQDIVFQNEVARMYKEVNALNQENRKLKEALSKTVKPLS